MSTKKPAKSPIIHNGKEYVSMTEYRDRCNFSGNSGISERIADGMPHLVIMNGKQKELYFNIEDCGDWHAGGHLEGEKEGTG